MKRKKLLLIGSIGLLLILLALPIAGCKTAEPAEAKTLRIGSIVGLTGFMSSVEVQSDREVRALADMVNDDGGITVDGQQYNIELVTEDTESTIDGTAAAARKLAYDEQVKFVTGPTAFFSTASSPIFEKEKVLHVDAFNTLTPEELSPDSPYGFLGHNSTIGNFDGTIKGVKEFFPDVKNIVLIHPDDGTIPYVIPKMTKIAEGLGFNIVGDTVMYPNEMIDFSPIGAQLNAIKDADAFIQVNGVPPHMIGMIKSLRSLGNTKPFIISIIQDCESLKEAVGEEAATNIMTCGMCSYTPDNPPLLAELIDRIDAQYGPNPAWMYNPNCLCILLNVIEEAQSIDPEVVKTSWESMDTVETLFGTGTMGGLETYGIKHAVGCPLYLQTLIDGEVSCKGWVDVVIP